MKHWGIVALLVAFVLLGWILFRFREGFETAFIDHTNEEKTDETRVSSYAQQTNNYKPPTPPIPPPSGMETPYRVNIWDSYIPA
jgi:hypothetical protein